MSSDADADAFNWTSTYRRDSDLPQPYGYFWQDVRMGQKPRTIGTDHVANKTKQVAWFVFNCDVHDNRSAYADELAKHIPVDVYDVYGDCGLLKCPWSTEDRCFRMLEDDYKFYLAFEDAHCRQYITEKFFVNALR